MRNPLGEFLEKIEDFLEKIPTGSIVRMKAIVLLNNFLEKPEATLKTWFIGYCMWAAH